MVNTRAGNYDKAIGFSYEALNDMIMRNEMELSIYVL